MDIRGTNDEERNALRIAMGEYLHTGDIKTTCPRCGKALVFERQGTRDLTHCEDPKCIGMVLIGI